MTIEEKRQLLIDKLVIPGNLEKVIIQIIIQALPGVPEEKIDMMLTILED